jgi:hypothetical protein
MRRRDHVDLFMIDKADRHGAPTNAPTLFSDAFPHERQGLNFAHAQPPAQVAPRARTPGVARLAPGRCANALDSGPCSPMPLLWQLAPIGWRHAPALWRARPKARTELVGHGSAPLPIARHGDIIRPCVAGHPRPLGKLAIIADVVLIRSCLHLAGMIPPCASLPIQRPGYPVAIGNAAPVAAGTPRAAPCARAVASPPKTRTELAGNSHLLPRWSPHGHQRVKYRALLPGFLPRLILFRPARAVAPA